VVCSVLVLQRAQSCVSQCSNLLATRSHVSCIRPNADIVGPSDDGGMTGRRFTMLVDKNDRAPRDLTRVGVEEDWEVRYWCARFSVSAEELRACVLEVGPRTEDVERRLKEAGRKAFSNTGED
jgi:hypothetical protein